MFVGVAIEFDMTWQLALEANALVVYSVVSSLLGAFRHSACIYRKNVNVALDALILVAVFDQQQP
jgi:hypothetical protein